MGGRAWSEEDIATVRALHGKRTLKQIAEMLGRTWRGVANVAYELGIIKQYGAPDDVLEFIRAQHAAGKLDAEIEREWNAQHPDRPVKRRNVTNWRRNLGLPINREALLRCKRAAYERQMRVLGISSFNVLAARRQRRVAIKAGLPLDLRPLEVRIFQVLLRGGYWTRQELAEAIGSYRKKQRSWFKCRYGSKSALDNLVDRGLVKRTEHRTRKMGGKGRTAYEYWVPLDVMRRFESQRRRLA
jgi:predicted transcriptional regulator